MAAYTLPSNGIVRSLLGVVVQEPMNDYNNMPGATFPTTGYVCHRHNYYFTTTCPICTVDPNTIITGGVLQD